MDNGGRTEPATIVGRFEPSRVWKGALLHEQ